MHALHCSNSMKIITLIIDSLFPPRPSQREVERVTAAVVTTLYSPGIYRGYRYLSSYQNPVISALITENKFHGNNHATHMLTALLSHWVNTQAGPLCFIPMPLSRKRERERGYNQVQRILEAVTDISPMIRTDIIKRVRHTVPQVSLSKNERITNLNDAFVVSVPTVQLIKDTTIILVDDVCTTGTTLHVAEAAIKPHLHPSSKLICVALAH